MTEHPEEAAGGAELLRRLIAGEPVYVDTGEGLARLQVWTQAEWDRLEEAERPTLAEYLEGLGWVVAVPVRDVN
jgi:hypothetical protein